jgi:predicted amidohydrolase
LTRLDTKVTHRDSTEEKHILEQKSSHRYRLAVGQFEPTFFDKQANLAKMEVMARQGALAGAQLVIFPECCVTSYQVGQLVHEMAEVAEVIHGPDRGPSVRHLEILANELSLQFIFGIPEWVNGQTYNSAVHVVPEQGVVSSYHKVHLWETEEEVFTPGDRFSVHGGPLGLLGSLVCYDLEFPEASRLLAIMGAQLIAVSTANMRPWVESNRMYARARAMENCLFTAVANCIGKSGSTEFFGGSIIVDPYGQILAEAGSSEALLVADIDLDIIADAEEKTGHLQKRRPELYRALSSVSVRST